MQVWIIFLILGIFSIELFAITPPGYCTTLSATPTNRAVNPCVYVVNYPFFVPNGVSLEYLRKKASDSLNNTQLLNLSPNCQGALVRYTCSLIYRKCQPGIKLNDTSTYNFNIYMNDTGLMIPLPIQRPCVSVCTALSTICADPLFVFAAKGYPSCYSKLNYAGLSTPLPYQFDLKNDNTKCYSPMIIPLAGPKEKYVGGTSAPCNGLVDEFFMLPGNLINPAYTVLLPATMVQTMLNAGLSQAFQQFPKWLSPDCNIAIRQYFCYQYFFRPQPVSIRQGLITGITGGPYQPSMTQILLGANALYPGLLDRSIYFPRYANRSVCNNYESVCAEFRFRAENPFLEPNCSRKASGSYVFPPAINQTILTTKFPIVLGGNTIPLTLSFRTAPDYSVYKNETQMAYTTQCPPKYSINPDPTNDEIDEVHGSGCAANCRLGFWTDSEWASFDRFSIIVSGISVAFCVIVLVVIVATNDWKTSYLIFFFTLTSLVCSIYQLALTAGTPWEQRFCATDVLRRRRSDGPSNCMRHATVSSFLYLTGCIIILLISLQRTLELTGYRSVLSKSSYNVFQFTISLIPPLFSVALAWAYSFLGFAGATPWCAMDLIPSVFLMGFPVLVICILTYIVYIYGSVYSWRRDNPAKVAITNASNITAVSSVSNSAAHSTALSNGGSSSNNNSRVASSKPAANGGMTVISIGATVDVSPVRAFDEEEYGNDGYVAVAATPAMQSDIEMKQLAAGNSEKNVGDDVPLVDASTNDDGAMENISSSSKPILTEVAAHNIRMNIVLTSFIAGSVIIHIGWVILKIANLIYGQAYYDSFVDYTICIFRNWNGYDTASYEGACGMYPETRPEISGMMFYILCLFGNMLVMGPIYLVSSYIAYRRVKNSKGAIYSNINSRGNNASVAKSLV